MVSREANIRTVNSLIRFLRRFLDAQPKPHTGVITRYEYQRFLEIELDDIPAQDEERKIVFRYEDDLLFVPAEDSNLVFLRRVRYMFQKTRDTLDHHRDLFERHKTAHLSPDGLHDHSSGGHNHPGGAHNHTQQGPHTHDVGYSHANSTRGDADNATDVNVPGADIPDATPAPEDSATSADPNISGVTDHINKLNVESQPYRYEDNLEPNLAVGDKIALLPISQNKYLVIRLRPLP